MTRNAWSTAWRLPVANVDCYRRAFARRRWNRERRLMALWRRNRLLELLPVRPATLPVRLSQLGWPQRGDMAAAAKALHVHKSTISRDVAAIKNAWRRRRELLPFE